MRGGILTCKKLWTSAVTPCLCSLLEIEVVDRQQQWMLLYMSKWRGCVLRVECMRGGRLRPAEPPLEMQASV